MDVGTGDVHFQELDLLYVIQFAAVLRVLLQGKPAHVGDDGPLENLRDVGYFLCNHGVNTGILETHGVQHSSGHLRDAGLGIAQPGLAGGALPGEAAQDVQVV